MRPPFVNIPVGVLLALPSLSIALAQEPAKPEEAPKLADDSMRVFWKDGLRFESADKRYKFKIGGRIHYDMAFFAPDDATKDAVETGTSAIEDGAEIRRSRIELSGEVADNVDWAASYDFGGARTNCATRTSA